MGISELLKMLKPIIRQSDISEFKGKKVGVDIMSWIYRGIYASSIELNNGNQSDLYLNFPLKMLSLLYSNGIIPIVVFDGNNLPAKEITHKNRKEEKDKTLKLAEELKKEGNFEESQKNYRRVLKIKSIMINTLIEILKRLGIQVLVAPYEADAQIAYLYKIGLIDMAISEDSDLLAYGTKKIIYKLNQDGKCEYLNFDEIRNNENTISHIINKMSFYNFVELCVMSGCDYICSIKGFGFKTGLKFFEKFGVIDKVVHNLKYINKFEGLIPDDYLQNAKKVVSLFYLQKVYDPLNDTLKNLNDIENEEIKEQLSIYNKEDEYYGKNFDNYKDFCKGDIDIKMKINKKLEPQEVINKYYNKYKNDFKKISLNTILPKQINILDELSQNDIDEQNCLHESIKSYNRININNTILENEMNNVIKFCNSANKTPSKQDFEIEKPKNLYDLLIQEKKSEDKIAPSSSTKY